MLLHFLRFLYFLLYLLLLPKTKYNLCMNLELKNSALPSSLLLLYSNELRRCSTENWLEKLRRHAPFSGLIEGAWSPFWLVYFTIGNLNGKLFL